MSRMSRTWISWRATAGHRLPGSFVKSPKVFACSILFPSSSAILPRTTIVTTLFQDRHYWWTIPNRCLLRRQKTLLMLRRSRIRRKSSRCLPPTKSEDAFWFGLLPLVILFLFPHDEMNDTDAGLGTPFMFLVAGVRTSFDRPYIHYTYKSIL